MLKSNERLSLLKRQGVFGHYILLLVASFILFFGVTMDIMGQPTLSVYHIFLLIMWAWITGMVAELRRVDRPFRIWRTAFYVLFITAMYVTSLRGTFWLFDSPAGRWPLIVSMSFCFIAIPWSYIRIHRVIEKQFVALRPRALTWFEILYGVMMIGWPLHQYFLNS